VGGRKENGKDDELGPRNAFMTKAMRRSSSKGYPEF